MKMTKRKIAAMVSGSSIALASDSAHTQFPDKVVRVRFIKDNSGYKVITHELEDDIHLAPRRPTF